MAMVNLPAARRHHRSRLGYALGLLALLGTATALALVVRHPAFSATEQLAEPVPAPEITVAGQGSAPPGGPENEPGWAADPGADPSDPAALPGPGQAGAGGGALAEPDGGPDRDDPGRSLFYSGLLGLAISLAGLGLVGTRRRQW
ncbi:hypothetical protein [Micromonospora auratinigra]|uniref:Uncharacterized protein n=1 Tax=Micromonospora auratinigra TaxID=261654 RepID=A0A1A9A0I4_9ACTN|nr:hypothetical protein [Micromonospora auratinigra]SBT49930.1 hypothetical protein GA0070611_4595 [Micromonospora auratinigra]